MLNCYVPGPGGLAPGGGTGWGPGGTPTGGTVLKCYVPGPGGLAPGGGTGWGPGGTPTGGNGAEMLKQTMLSPRTKSDVHCGLKIKFKGC